MDPWNNSKECETEELCNQFEDNFAPETTKLPDSEKYLAILEEKLHKIKSDPNVVQQLEKKREDCLSQLLNASEHACSDDLSLDKPIESPAILRTILPQKQALTQGEIAKLLQHDHLNKSDMDLSQEDKSDT